MRRALVVAVAVLAPGLAGCRGKLLGTVPLKGPGAATARVTVGAKPPILWADMDGKWKGPKSSKMDVSYDVEVVRGGASVGKIACSTTNHGGTTVCGTHLNIMGEHDADCEVNLACPFPKIAPGEVELRVVARTGPNVVLARKLSLNVRED